jgi:predicted ribosome quality control (RQC) complex YloA/Tae2 family protein
METKFECIHLTKEYRVVASGDQVNTISFRLTSPPPNEWLDQLKLLMPTYPYPIQVKYDYIAIDLPSKHQFEQTKLDELKSLIKNVNTNYRHSLEEHDKKAEASKEQARKGEEQLELIKSKIQNLNFDK